MSFSVDTAALAGLPNLLDRLGDDARASRVYFTKHSTLKDGQGLFNIVLGGHRTAVQRVTTFFDGLDAAAHGQSGRVQVAVNHYKRTDLKAAAALDATTPGVPGAPSWRPHDVAGAAGFADRVEPQDLLKPPRDYSADFSFEMKWHSYLSPTSYGRWVIWEVTSLAAKLGICDRPIDVFVEWLKPWLGDWAGLRACADVYLQLREAAGAMDTNLQGSIVDTVPTWAGNAADGCREDLDKTHLALVMSAHNLQRLADEYISVSKTTYKQAEVVAGLLGIAIDLAVTALLELQLAVATSETLVGGVAFGVAAAHTIWRVIETGAKIYDCFKIATYGVKAFEAVVEGLNIIDPGRPFPGVSPGRPLAPAHSSSKPI